VRCLVVGGGGREHALVRALLASARVTEVLAAPGNPGIASEPGARCVAVGANDIPGLVALAREGVDLTVVGPEAPLVAGLADALRAAGCLVLGPGAGAARLEGSKAFAKEIMAAAGVPTAGAQVFSALEPALAALPDGPSVIKADGLAAGKGVVVAADRATAAAALHEMLGERRFGEAGAQVLIEDYLEGEEVSVIALCDGHRALCFPPAQDHKRLGEGDTGPNTGGMGAYAPAPCLPEAALEAVREMVLLPVLAELRRRGMEFRGFLYAGLMLTSAGVRVLEFNVRFGDPEAQPLLGLTAGDDLADLFAAAAAGALPEDARLPTSAGAAACVVLASEGYPRAPRVGDRIEGLDQAAGVDGVHVFHAGTRAAGGAILTAGGRVLGVTGLAPDLRQALGKAYEAAAHIRWPGRQMRADIGHRALSH
jgi:phosphoribosylamine---glycine ligase